MVPGSTLRYGSSLSKRTLYPRACKSAPSAADARPFPREETTPPVMKINRAMEGQHDESGVRTQAESSGKKCVNASEKRELVRRQYQKSAHLRETTDWTSRHLRYRFGWSSRIGTDNPTFTLSSTTCVSYRTTYSFDSNQRRANSPYASMLSVVTTSRKSVDPVT